MPLVTVAMITHNMGKSLVECLQALRHQSFKDFEIVLVDDRSTDGTRETIQSFSDLTIHYSRNEKKMGYGATRNLSLNQATGKYVFFTDADCIPAEDWLQNGLKAYQEKKCIGLVGKTLPLRESVKRSERVVANLIGRYMTCNMSFTREILTKLNGFDPAFDAGQEDVELGLRAKQHGEIYFAEDMLVSHQVYHYKLKTLFKDASRYKTQVMIFKRYPNDEYHQRFSPRIAHGVFLKPEDWWTIFLPIFLFRSSTNQSLEDFLIIPFVYLATVYRRLVIWRTALREKIFLI